MKIVAFVLENFMNHVNSTIKVSDTLTCITGKNDSGKSVIIYAMKWFNENEPKGDMVISKFNGKQAKSCSVTVVMDNDIRLKKTRYLKGGTQFEAPHLNQVWGKSDLPKEIDELVGIKSTSFGLLSYDLNFSFQLDSPFLISEAASSAATVISKFAGTELLNLVNKDIETENWNLKRDSNKYELQIKDIDAKLHKYDFVDSSIAELNKIKERNTTLTKKLELGVLLEKLNEDYIKLSNENNSFVNTINIFSKNKFDKQVASAAILKISHTVKEDLSNLNYRYEQNSYIISKLHKTVTITNKIADVEDMIDKKVVLDIQQFLVASFLSKRYDGFIINDTNNKLTITCKALKKFNLDELDKSIPLGKHNICATYVDILNKYCTVNFKVSKYKYILNLIFYKFDKKDYINMQDIYILSKMYKLGISDKERLEERIKAIDFSLCLAEDSVKSIWNEVGYVCPTCNTKLKKGETLC